MFRKFMEWLGAVPRSRYDEVARQVRELRKGNELLRERLNRRTDALHDVRHALRDEHSDRRRIDQAALAVIEYLEKPFNQSELVVRISRLREVYKKWQVHLPPTPTKPVKIHDEDVISFGFDSGEVPTA